MGTLEAIGFAALSLAASPALWLGVLLSFWIGARRIKRERNLFRSRTRGKRTDVLETLLPGLAIGAFLSVVSVLLGLTVTPVFLIVFTAVASLILLAGVVRLSNPLWPLTAIAVLLIAGVAIPSLGELGEVSVFTILAITALSLIGEVLLVRMRGTKRLSPSLVLSKRGRFIGGLAANKLWLVPLVLFVPGESLGFLPFDLPAVVPVVLVMPIGFSFLFTGDLPKVLVRPLLAGRFATAGLSLLLALGAYFLDRVEWLYGLPVLLALHLFLHQRAKRLNRQKTPLFSNGERGVVILGTLAGKPADSMGLVAGEAIHKVNGDFVDSERAFYEAIQRHKPYLRLEVMNHNGDVRFAQRAFYEQDHHELGILFVNEPAHQRTKIKQLH
ncbi:PDZ domain-containing protein [Exiguobacterium flavidum]|uniref:PDZ domain-containing protein n=1 Tax=Exiguobacterium flavidum TaxID=2184695 RepID=UPI000DF78068|nr:PDZ domain-containing protein [Exiguobacterium flavidum]